MEPEPEPNTSLPEAELERAGIVRYIPMKLLLEVSILIKLKTYLGEAYKRADLNEVEN